MERWQGRVAVVTGASAGIGAAIAKLLGENGMKVVGCARRVERIEEMAKSQPNIFTYKAIEFQVIEIKQNKTGKTAQYVFLQESALNLEF